MNFSTPAYIVEPYHQIISSKFQSLRERGLIFFNGYNVADGGGIVIVSMLVNNMESNNQANRIRMNYNQYAMQSAIRVSLMF